jgi:hypothetical protein
MDSIVYEETVNTEVSSSEFVDKQWLYVNDNNNGSYSSQVVLDTTPIANSGSYINWSEAFILMPLVLQFESAAIGLAAANTAADYLGALKSGYWNILHSLTCEFNQGSVVQQVPFLNVFCSFKNITSWSQNDLTDWGSVCGFMPDSARSWAYLPTAPDGVSATSALGASGYGLTNNRDSPYISIAVIVGTNFVSGPTLSSIANYNINTRATQSSADFRQAWNEGLFAREQMINYDPVLIAGNANSSNKGSLMDSAGCSQVFRTFVNATTDNARWFAIDAVIRLKDVADFFQKVPLLKGSTMRIYLNTNQCYFQVAQTGASYTALTGALSTQPILSLTTAPVILGGGGTCPVMYTSAGLGQGASVLTPLAAGAPATATVKVALSIARTQFNQMTNTFSCPITSVRLYAPAYTLSPLAEQRLLTLTPTKRVIYNDIFQFSFPNQSVNSPFNILVTNGIPNIRSVLVLAMLPNASNGTAAAGGVKTSSILSPFSSTPSTPDPLIIQNFQIQVSGKNLFINQLQYDYEDFVEQLVSSNQLNGSLTTSLASGLVSKQDFQNLYRYYYGNCSRSIPSEEGVAKAIQIQGTILSPLATAVDLMVFVEFERLLEIDLRSGARI